MAWDAAYAFEGIFVFGGPLNVHQYVIDSGKFGQSTQTYHVAHFRLDDDRDLERRLMDMMRAPGPIQYFPVLYLLGRRSTDSSQWRQEKMFFKPWLFSLTRGFKGMLPPLEAWPGPTLGIACNSKDNPHIITTDW